MGGVKALVTRRLKGSVYAGWWEFPGGKLEAGETPEACVRRELAEELGVEAEVVGGLPGLEEVRHVYEHAAVRLHPRLCLLAPASSKPQDLLVAEHRWVNADELAALAILPANRPIVDAVVALLLAPGRPE